MKWILQEAPDEEVFPYVVETLSDKQQVVPYTEERFSTWNQALARARLLNENGFNVRVLRELAFCVNEE
jgi:hypothetical protein